MTASTERLDGADGPGVPPRYKIATPLALPPATVLALSDAGFGPFELTDPTADDADVLLLDGCAPADDGVAIERLRQAPAGAALIVVVDELRPDTVLPWLAGGAQDVICTAELEAPGLPQRLRSAIERKRLERDARLAYATDLDTGLPHQQQLIEHMSQLLALREREPAPMAVLVLRIEGLAATAARLGGEASSVLRRKVGVRLRAGVRASDVVASIGEDRFAVLLGSILAPADAGRVGAKLVKALLEPLRVAGHDVSVAAALGIGQYPQDGAQPDALLRRAVGLAAGAQAVGRAGFANFGEPGATAPAGAANDE